jgi:hypothetical protein
VDTVNELLLLATKVWRLCWSGKVHKRDTKALTEVEVHNQTNRLGTEIELSAEFGSQKSTGVELSVGSQKSRGAELSVGSQKSTGVELSAEVGSQNCTGVALSAQVCILMSQRNKEASLLVELRNWNQKDICWESEADIEIETRIFQVCGL